MNDWDIRKRLIDIQNTQYQQGLQLTRIEKKLDALYDLIANNPVASDLRLLFGNDSPATSSGEKIMSKQLTVKLWPKGHKNFRQVMPPITLTKDTTSILFQSVDQNGNPIAMDPTLVNTTATVDLPALFVITAGADSLHYNATIPANATGTVNVTAEETYITPPAPPAPPGPFNSSCAVTLPTPPAPVPTDLQIIFG